MNTRALLVIGVSSLTVSVAAASWSLYQSHSRSQSSVTDVPWPDTEEYVRIEIQWPHIMQANESAWVTASVAPKHRTRIPEFSGSSASAGPEEVLMTANLVGTGFDIKAVVADPQPVKGRAGLAWSWMVTPKFVSPQALAMLLYIERRPQGGGVPSDRQFFHGGGTIVGVRDPGAIARLEFFALLTGALGLLLSLPSPVEAIIRRIEERSKRRLVHR